ncbi:Obg family GTPase CgtA [Enterobacterales bacterium endosymbiont of Anomoneura mori]|uniref:Obg family GTPase CgtA n=1 Tax=Enterobacterales bacterium endosymbiont of Anomoneura mori TaxID=3132096 RepID=UPI00399CFED6
MKFIDEAYIKVIAGKGGDGCISFRREKYEPYGGPNGGDGGNGGNIYLCINKNLNTLTHLNYKKIFCAKNGENGKSKLRTGKTGKDLFIYVPTGTIIKNKINGEFICEMNLKNKKFLIARGGYKGLGNNHFKSSINRTPYKKTFGKLGEIKHLYFKLLLLADVGVIGLPNAGKSTFVNLISSSKNKIGIYPFTTIIPKLGFVYIKKNEHFIIVDIPGLIKNSSKGNGLGYNFLKHIERCKLLLLLIDIKPLDNTNIIKNIKIIINEIKIYNKNLLKKPFWLIFNKIDLIEKKKINNIVKNVINKINWKNKYYTISCFKNEKIKKLCSKIMNFIKKIK